MTHLLLPLLLLAADPTPEQVELLTIFRKEFVAITPGEGKFTAAFEMGRAQDGDENERPVQKIVFKHKFAIAKYEVPQNLWEAVMGTNPSKWKGKRNSVEWLTYDEAMTFCTKATELMRAAKLIEPKQSVRLPSEAEWEYCARAGTTTVYSFGDDAKDLDDYAWSTQNAAGNDPPVGAKKPNDWGLYDMHGYLWEWTADAGQDSHKDAMSNGRPRAAPKDGEKDLRVLRSGSWKDKAGRLTSTARRVAPVETRDDAVGLRCVLE
jgi:formylglycine-generating enzyme required for sulfatase activity